MVYFLRSAAQYCSAVTCFSVSVTT